MLLNFDQRSFGVTGVKKKVKILTSSNEKSNSVNVLAWEKHQKSMVTSLSDL